MVTERKIKKILYSLYFSMIADLVYLATFQTQERNKNVYPNFPNKFDHTTFAWSRIFESQLALKYYCSD